MAKKKYPVGEEWRKYASDFTELKDELGLDESNPMECVHKLVDAGNSLQGQICAESDEIKIDMLDEAKELTKVGENSINKGTWQEFAARAAQVKDKPMSEKSMERNKEKNSELNYLSNLRTAFLDSYIKNGRTANILIDNDNSVPDENVESSNDFFTLIDKAGDIRYHINKVLYKKYRQLANAFQYITKGNYTYKDFKTLVDFEHYKGSEDPAYPDRALKMAERFIQSWVVNNEYGYDYFNSILEDNGLKIVKA